MISISSNLNIMIKAAEKASKSVIRDFGEVEKLQVSKKGPRDFVTKTDKHVEKILIEELSKTKKNYSFLSEEVGSIQNKDKDNIWIIDPIDGTRSYVIGRPLWGTLISLAFKGEPIIGMADFPALDERWIGYKNKCLLNNVAFKKNYKSITSISEATVGSTGPHLFSEIGKQKYETLIKNSKYHVWSGDCHNYCLLLKGGLDLVVEEIRELLTSYKFPGDKIPIIKGSALAAVEDKDEAIGKNSILELLKAIDDHIPQPTRPKDKPFLMPVEDVFTISGRGTVVTGRVEQGVVKTGEEVEIVGIRETKKSVCTGVEMFRKILDVGEAGDNIGVLLRGIERTDVERGQVLCKPGSVTPHTKFEAQAYVLKKEEGGRHTPFFTKYRPQFYFRTTDVTGEVELPAGTEMVMPGDDAKFTVKLITPIAMAEKLNFAIREGGRTVGAGVVTKIIE